MTQRQPGRRGWAILLTISALVVAAPASADEIPALLPGASVAMKGTHVTCVAAATSVKCFRAGGLAATLTKAGKVSVTKSSQGPSTGKKLGVNAGFGTANAPIYCHVYVAGGPTMTCSEIEPAGGLANTRGFDISDRSVVVFRYGTAHDRHDIKTYSQT